MGDIKIEKLILPRALDRDELAMLSLKFCVHNYKDKCEVLGAGVNKFVAANRFCSDVGITLDEVLYFGDDINDTECFENFRNCVAMGNSAEEIKILASYITADNDNNGVAQALAKFFEK